MSLVHWPCCNWLPEWEGTVGMHLDFQDRAHSQVVQAGHCQSDPFHGWNDPAAIDGCAVLLRLSKTLHCNW